MRLLFFIVTFFCFINQTNAQLIDSKFYGWTVYEIQPTELDEKKCYIASYPFDSKTNHNSRQTPYIMITRYQDSRTEEISIYGGFEYKIDSKIFFTIDEKQFTLKTKENVAWAKSRQEDALIIQSLLNGTIVKIRSDSSIGTFAVDEYTTKGIARAYSRMREICI